MDINEASTTYHKIIAAYHNEMAANHENNSTSDNDDEMFAANTHRFAEFKQNARIDRASNDFVDDDRDIPHASNFANNVSSKLSGEKQTKLHKLLNIYHNIRADEHNGVDGHEVAHDHHITAAELHNQAVDRPSQRDNAFNASYSAEVHSDIANGTEEVTEWANSIDNRHDDRGTAWDQPEGDTINLSMRRYLGAKPQIVTIEEGVVTTEIVASLLDTFKGNTK
jgi:hypothetical protein